MYFSYIKLDISFKFYTNIKEICDSFDFCCCVNYLSSQRKMILVIRSLIKEIV